jgi:hypothetical protein
MSVTLRMEIGGRGEGVGAEVGEPVVAGVDDGVGADAIGAAPGFLPETGPLVHPARHSETGGIPWVSGRFLLLV